MSAPPRPNGEAGFTLIELLVGMAASFVVIAGVVTVLMTTLNQTQIVTDRVASTRATRLALAQVENELHSACVGTGTTQNLAPIQPGSDANHLIFVSYTGPSIISASGPSPNALPTWHVLSVTNNTLTDASYAVTGSDGDWTPAATPTNTQTLLPHVVPDGTAPYFQYFHYESYPIPGDTSEDYWTIPDGSDSLPDGVTPTPDPVPAGQLPLTSGADGTAASTVEVVISLTGGSGTGAQPTDPETMDPEVDAISMRLTEPANEAPATSGGSYGPCE